VAWCRLKSVHVHCKKKKKKKDTSPIRLRLFKLHVSVDLDHLHPSTKYIPSKPISRVFPAYLYFATAFTTTSLLGIPSSLTVIAEMATSSNAAISVFGSFTPQLQNKMVWVREDIFSIEGMAVFRRLSSPISFQVRHPAFLGFRTERSNILRR
jgi:hypothetical protein